MTKSIVYTSIVTNNGSKLLYDAIILKNRENNTKLLSSSMV